MVYLLDGDTLQEISRLTGSRQNDQVGGDDSGEETVRILKNGDFVVSSLLWDNGSVRDAGAVTYCSAVTGCDGPVSAQNSLVGTSKSDRVGQVTPLESGGYVVVTNGWDFNGIQDAGAATYCAPGDCTGPVRPENSLTGRREHDGFMTVTPLSGGGYVVAAPSWNNWRNGLVQAAGAVTACPAAGCRGMVISADNSLVGTTYDDRVGAVGTVYALENGGYVVRSPVWDRGSTVDAGAVTGCPATGCKGSIDRTNSLVGAHAHDQLGEVEYTGDVSETGLLLLPQGGYLIPSPFWDNGSQTDAGALTPCPSGRCVGEVSAANSLVGASAGDGVGKEVQLLPGGGYLAASPNWSSPTAPALGAVTPCPPAGCVGNINPENSLTGSQAEDSVGFRTRVFENGDYAVFSLFWDREDLMNAGAVSICSESRPCTGPVSEQNSLVGSSTEDLLGNSHLFALESGYLLSAAYWHDASGASVGAYRFCSGPEDCTGPVTAENSLVSSQPGFMVGVDTWAASLPGGGFAVSTPLWDRGVHQAAGAVTFCGRDGCAGQVISEANSLTGSRAGDYVGSHSLTPLPDGSLVISSSYWNKGSIKMAGAVTRCTPETCAGQVVSEANSLTGADVETQVGSAGITLLNNGAFLVGSPFWPTSVFYTNRIPRELGALTFCQWDSCAGQEVTAGNSLVGRMNGDHIGSEYGEIYLLPGGGFVVRSPELDNGEVWNAGAVTPCPPTGCTGEITAENSVLGNAIPESSDDELEEANIRFFYDAQRHRLFIKQPLQDRIVILDLERYGSQSPTAVSLSASAGELAQGQELLLTASVTSDSGPPPGQVTFFAGSTRLGRAALDPDGRALFSTTSLPPGLHSLTARYEGNYNFEPSTSEPVSVSVLPAQPTAITLSLSDSRPAPGQPLTLRAQVTSGSGPPSGAVAFYDGESLLGQAQLDGNGQASLTVALEAGSHSLSARYLGGDGYAASASAPVALQVGGAAPASPRLFLPLVGG